MRAADWRVAVISTMAGAACAVQDEAHGLA